MARLRAVPRDLFSAITLLVVSSCSLLAPTDSEIAGGSEHAGKGGTGNSDSGPDVVEAGGGGSNAGRDAGGKDASDAETGTDGSYPKDAPNDAPDCTYAAGGAPAASSLKDDFSDGVPEPNWQKLDACANEKGGRFVAEVPGGAGTYCLFVTQNVYRLTCDSVTFKVPQTTSLVVGVQTVMYIESATADERIMLVREAGGFLLGSVSNDVDGPEARSTAYDAVGDLWWRLREGPGTGGRKIFLETSANGSDWTVRAQVPRPFSVDRVKIMMGAGAWQTTSSPGSAAFDCYNMPPSCS
jgi:hypothetical protein